MSSNRRRRFFRLCSIVVVACIAIAAPVPAQAAVVPPSNDDCAGAIVVPPVPDGNTTILTDAVDISQAMPQGADEGLHPCSGGGADRTIWYSFTPSTTGEYVISTCGTTAAGNTVYDTVLSVFDSTGGACPQTGSPVACDDSYPCETPVLGAPYEDQGTISTRLTAGRTYFVVAGHWAPDAGGVSGVNKMMVLSFQFLPAPRNDDCRVTDGGYAAGGTGPAPLALDRISYGTTAFGTNDYRSIGCPFLAPGEIETTANGADVVFSFTPQDSGAYSIRYVMDDRQAALRGQSPVLYISTQCPLPSPTTGVPGCFAAANRMDDQTTGNDNRSEELDCIPLTGGTTYFVFFDDAFTANPGGDLAMEVTRCNREVEPNDVIATATPWAANAGCFMEGGVVPSGTTAGGGDVDFYALGAPPAGSKIFAAVDAAASNDGDYELRITSATDTLAYDDNDGTTFIGSNAPIVSGPIAPGGNIYARVNGKTTLAGNGPYRLYVKTESGTPEFETAPDPTPDGRFIGDWLYGAQHVTQGGFLGGTIQAWDAFGPFDLDCWRFVAHEGDQLMFFTDNNPSRSPGSITNIWPTFFTATGKEPGAGTRYVGQLVRNLHPNVPQLGTLEGTEATGAPSVTSEFLQYRARYTGWYGICLTPTGDAGGVENPPAGAYPLPYRASLSINCGPIPPPQPADVAIAQAGPVGVVNAGDFLEYTITITNNDASAIAQDVRIVDHLPPQLVVLDVAVDDGFAGGDTSCLTLPALGDNDAPIDCTHYSLAPSASVTYTLTVQVRNCIAPGQAVHNEASVTSYTQDANAANNTASWEFTTGYTGACTPVICSPGVECFVNSCQVDNACTGIGGVCQGNERNCDDGSVCTIDSCDPSSPAHPCVNDSSQNGDLCDDGNDCTDNACDPVQFCVFPPKTAGLACNDFLHCTNDDSCDGNGSCFGHTVCDDGLPCTDDSADEANNCACENDPSFPGTFCDDGNVCTTGTTCDGTGPTAAACTGGASVGCDDGDPCTYDACDPVAGCAHTSALSLETQNVRALADKATFTWSAVANATRYDVVRGSTSAFPVGPGGADELCFGGLASPSVTDAAVPANGAGFWYLSRSGSACGNGSYGSETNGSQRTSTTCP